ncbi:MAG: hypothetical protein PUF69_04240 [Eubacteriales bacterium]|nr:hypothetical protein [Eubacteriales bacterium]
MRVAGIIITSMGALGLLSLCAKGDFYNGLIGGGVMIIIGIIMILKGKSRKEVAAIKEAKQIEKAKDREVKRQIKLAKQQEQAAERNRIHQENSRIKFNETNFESADFYNYNLYDSAYRQIMDKYYKNMEKIQTNASILYNLGVIDGEKMDDLIQLCYQNIDEFKQACTQWRRYGESCPPSAPAFERLAIIYERQEKYEEAIKICVEAIKAGLAEDDYKKRIARLLKKSGTENLEKYQDLLLR